jgi:beta-phosphoglucomutase-like phosphatase (HAD superfamily)
MNLSGVFQATVTAEDGMETRSQQLLSAAIKLGRPPKQCVAFVSDIEGIAAAHNTSLRAVGVMGEHPGYRLNTADLTCGNMRELTVYNIRRIFANVGCQLMDLKRMASGEQSRPLRPSRVASS